MNANIFKAYDIRGKYPKEINEKIVSRIIAAVIKNFKSKKIIVGRDTRLSSPKLYRTVINQFKIHSAGRRKKLKIMPAGLVTTPMLYFLTNYFNADLGIMITASHNPKEYNGLKIIGKNAVTISGKEIYNMM